LKDLRELIEGEKVESEDLELAQDVAKKVEEKLSTFEVKSFFGGKYDENDAILEIYAGAGGSDAQDWAEMLLKMYLKFCQKEGFKSEIITKSEGSEAGIKKAILEIKGKRAFGYLKGEKGVHRLVRQSPFNASALRQTSFAAVEVWPVLKKSEEVEINPKDLRVDTFRSSGAGGQHVNTTDSAVRITHLPTGTVVSCQSDRSQQKNREQAMKVLKAKLIDYFEAKKRQEEENLKGEKKSIEWGNQIRSYVFHPYKMVKDHRTDFQTSDVESVVEGDISLFLESYLKHSHSK
jgi:peptide chain release factor 2